MVGTKGPYEGCSATMVDVSSYDFTPMKDETVKLEESLIKFHVDECLEYDITISLTCRIRRVINAKYEKADLNIVMVKKCQHLRPEELYILPNLLSKSEDLFDGTLGTWNTTSIDLELKENTKPVCLRPYTIPRVHKSMFRK